MKPDQFWELSWREFWIWIDGYERRLDNDWRQSSEIIAGLRNLFALHTTKPGHRIKTVDGREINPYDTYTAPEKIPSTLADFKEVCEKFGIPWNPIKN